LFTPVRGNTVPSCLSLVRENAVPPVKIVGGYFPWKISLVRDRAKGRVIGIMRLCLGLE
jgi:hypothetical protein